MRLMRVLAITNLFPNPWQPHRATFNRQQFEALSKLHEVRVIAPVAWTHELASKWKGRAADRDAAAKLPDASARRLTVEYPRYVFPPRMLRGWHGHFLKWSIEKDFWRAVNEFRPHVVLGAWAFPDGWAAAKLGRQAERPVVIKVHGSDVLLLKRGSARRKRTIEALQRADTVIAVSRHLADHVIRLGISSKKVRVVYNGIDRNLFNSDSRLEARQRLGIGGGDNERGPLLLYVGNLVHVKGPDILINACRLLAARDVRFECCLIGEGAMKRRLEKQIRQWGLGERIHLVGQRPLGQMSDWYRSASMLILPSRSEGLPNVLLEALACGTPVVACDVGGVAEIQGLDARNIVPPNDALSLAAAIERQINAGQRATVSTPRGVSWSSSAQSLSQILEQSSRSWGGERALAA